MKYSEMPECVSLVHDNWGPVAAERARMQMIEYFRGGEYAPHFFVAEYEGVIIGFSAFEPTMLMRGAYNLIWIAVHKKHQAGGAGKLLTYARLEEIQRRGGQMVTLVTQKPHYFSKFGFFKLHHLGNEWYLMLKLFQAVSI